MIVKINGKIIPVCNINYVGEPKGGGDFNIYLKDRLPEVMAEESTTFQLNNSAEMSLTLAELHTKLFETMLLYHTT